MAIEPPPKVLLFDVFGTVVDWRSTVTEHLINKATAALSSPTASYPSKLRLRASSLTPDDWALFAQEWRTRYGVFCRTFDPAKDEYITIDEHHLRSLTELIATWDLDGLWDPTELREMSLIWHYLQPWADSVAGLAALNRRFVTSTLSNGNVSLLTDMAHFAGLPWQHILSSEHFRAFKPDPSTYQGAARKLEVRPEECALVAAHLDDLKAARACGYRTIFVERKLEETRSPEEMEKVKGEGWVDIWVDLGQGGFLEVARKLGLSP